MRDDERIWLDHERCYRVLSSRDARFDGWFYVAVRTTGIYCRPSCPARTPHRTNAEFLPTAAAAQQRGFRACKRCRPDASPGSPQWDVRADVVARAIRLIADGVVDRHGVPELGRRLGYSTRHLHRLLVAEVGAGPLALARAQRAQTARVLLEGTDVPVTDVAFAAGFASVRQFNDTVRSVYAASPSELRRRVARHARGAAPRPDAVAGAERAVTAAATTVRLVARRPCATDAVFEFLAARAVPGIEHATPAEYTRALQLPHGHGSVTVTPDDGAVRAQFRLADWRDLAPAVQRVRRLFDLDADPAAVDAVLSADVVLGGLVRRVPGRRVPGSVDPFETAARAVIGQQVSVAGARTVAGRVVAAVGEPLAIGHDTVTHVFPTPDALAEIADEHLPMPASRRRTLRTLAAAVADGSLPLHAGADRADVRDRLVALPGIGPWTADYVVMRGLHDPDVFLATDLGVRHALRRAGVGPEVAERWRPWRSYALHHLWASLTAASPHPRPQPQPQTQPQPRRRAS